MQITCPHCSCSITAPPSGICPICQGRVFGGEEDGTDIPPEGRVIDSPDWEAPLEKYAEPPVDQPDRQRMAQLASFSQHLLRNTPVVWCTPLLVFATVGVYVAMVANGVHPMTPNRLVMIEWGANFGPRTLGGEWWRLVTCMFLHFGFIHLGFNMWILWQLGTMVERLVGNWGMLLLYFVSGVFASLLSLAWHANVTSAGASGAVFGVCGALLGFVLLRRDTIPLEVINQWRGSLMAFLGYNLIFGLALPGIDMAAHIGGLIAGVACGAILSQPLDERTVSRRRPKNLALLTAAVICLPISVELLPPAPRDVEADWDRLSEMEIQIMDSYQDLVERNADGEFDNAEFAQQLEATIIPQWQTASELLQEIHDSPGVEQQITRKMLEYFRLRAESLEALAVAMRDDDLDAATRHRELWDEADELLKGMQ